MINVSVDASQLNKKLQELIEKFPRRLNKAVEKACEEIEIKAKANCPKKTGILQMSIGTDVQTFAGQASGRVGTNLDYAPYVHEGTGIHARNGDGRKRVPWCYVDEKTGEKIWTKGSHPQPFLENAVNEAAPGLLEHFNKLLEDG